MSLSFRSRPAISVVLPVYNGGTYLPAALRSVLDQEFQDFECILINDGSTDGSGEILRCFAREDARIRLVERENRGLIASLNEGLDLARGRFVARMDADDLCLPGRFSAQIRLLRESGADLCGSHHLIIDSDGRNIGSFIAPIDADALLLMLASTNPFAHGNVMLRRDFLERHGLRYGQGGVRDVEDYGLWLEMARHGARIVNVDAFLFCWRDTGASFSKTKRGGMRHERRRLSREYIRRTRGAIARALRRVDLERNRALQVQESILYTAWMHMFVNRDPQFFRLLPQVKRIHLPAILATLGSGRY